MRIVFMGSAQIACPCLESLMDGSADEVVSAVTKPDRPKGRRLHVDACPSKQAALRLQVPVLTPVDVNAPGSIEALAALAPDVIVVVAYGGILGEALLDLPPQGCVNVHFSLLPRYRGAAPVQWAIANGDTESGVTTLFMNARIDAGDILHQERVAISPDDTGGSLSQKLAARGARLLMTTLDDIRNDDVTRHPQDLAAASRAPKLKKSDGNIDWTRSAQDIHNRVRAFDPWPGTYCEAPLGSGNRLRITRSRAETAAEEAAGAMVPGQVVSVSKQGPLVATGDGLLRLLEVQPAGKRRMTGGAYMHGHALGGNDHLG